MGRRIVLAVMGLAVILVAGFFLGQRVAADTTLRFDPSAIGDKVVVIATSTGGSLATWAATQPGASDGVAAIAFISPNFGVKASGAEILTMPWGKQIAELVGGKERSFPPRNALHEKFWTTKYPIAAALPMAALTNLAY